MSSGKIVQVIGAVVDVEFPRDQLPKVYEALFMDDRGLTLEVQQQLGDGVVRTIALGSSEGLKRGLMLLPASVGSIFHTMRPWAAIVWKGPMMLKVNMLARWKPFTFTSRFW